MLGVDPGLTGALALLDITLASGTPPTLEVHDMPAVGLSGRGAIVESLLVHLVRRLAPDHAYVEAVHSMPKQGVASTFTFGLGFGIVRGVLAGLGVPVSLIPPHKWGRMVELPRGDGGSRLRVCQLFPREAHRFALKGHHGRADAALIALAGFRDRNPF